MSRALLDINVLIALHDSDHVDHERAHVWFESALEQGWASCPITENGFVRVISQPRYGNPESPAAAVAALATARGAGRHEFWACDVTLLDPRVIDRSRLLDPNQVTDAYLIALAVAHSGRFVTFDRAVSLTAVPGATEQDVVIL